MATGPLPACGPTVEIGAAALAALHLRDPETAAGHAAGNSMAGPGRPA